jgi:hypothetical protein
LRPAQRIFERTTFIRVKFQGRNFFRFMFP